MTTVLANLHRLADKLESAPPGHYCRIFGGKQIYDFAFCRNDGVAIPYSFKEVLVYSPLLSTTAPDVSQQAGRRGTRKQAHQPMH